MTKSSLWTCILLICIFAPQSPLMSGEKNAGGRIAVSLGPQSEGSPDNGVNIIPLNDDDDDENGFSDRHEGKATEQEDDLVELHLTQEGSTDQHRVNLNVFPATALRIWSSPGKGKKHLLELPAQWPTDENGDPRILYAEGVEISRKLNDITLRVWTSPHTLREKAVQLAVADIEFSVRFSPLLRLVKPELDDQIQKANKSLRTEERVGVFLEKTMPSVYQAKIRPEEAAEVTIFETANPQIARVEPKKPQSSVQALTFKGLTEGKTDMNARVGGRILARMPLKVFKEKWVLSFHRGKFPPATELFDAVGAGNGEEVRQILSKHDLDLNSIRKDGMPLLHKAVSKDRQKMIRLFIQKGANVNIANDKGRTPLHLAARKQGLSMCEMLMDLGATHKASDKSGTTPLHLAVKHSPNSELIRKLLNAGAEINAREKSGHTPLHIACIHKRKPIAKLLIGEGADVRKTLPSGSTALQMVARRGWVDVARNLLSAGANPRAVGRGGFTAIETAELAGHKKMVKLLRHHR